MLVKLFGPVQLQLTGMVLVVLAESVNGLPLHTGVLEAAVGVAGVCCMETVVVPAGEVQLLMVTVTLYVPEAATVTLEMEGSSKLEVKPFGPVQL